MPKKPEDLSIETGAELGPDLGLAQRPEDPPAEASGGEVYTPEVDHTAENKAIQSPGPMPAPDDDDGIDQFILSVDDQNNDAMTGKRLESLLGLPDEVAPPETPDEPPMKTGEKIGRTVSEVLYKAPLKGARDAIQNTLDMFMHMDNDPDFFGVKGTPLEFLNERIPGTSPLPAPGSPGTELPDPGETKTVVGGIEKNIAQFLTGFLLAKRVTGPLGELPAAGTYINSFVSMLTAFKGQDERLGNLIEELDPEHKGGIMTDVATYLKAEKDDPELLGRLKGALEDAGLGVLGQGVLKGVALLRQANKAKAALKANTLEGAAENLQNEDFVKQLAADNQPVQGVDGLLGSTDAQMIVTPNKLPGDLKPGETLSTSGEATAGLVPTNYKGQNININFNMIDTSDDLKAAVEQMKSSAPKPKAGEAAKQVIDPIQSATTPGTDRAYNLLLAERQKRIKTGTASPLKAEDAEAVKALWVSAGNKLAEVIKTARDAPTPENLFAFRKMLSTYGVINNELLGIRQATNKAVNIWKKSDQFPIRRMKEIEEVLERTGGVEDNKKLLDQLGRYIDDSPDAAVGIAHMAQASRRYGTVRAIRSFWTLGLLTNWKTHEVNAISNTMMMFMTAAERGMASKFSRAFQDAGEGVAPGEATAMLVGMWDSLGDAMRNAGRTMRTGQGGGAFNKVEQGFQADVFEDANTGLKKFVNTSMWYWGGIGRALQASDEFFKTLNMSAEVNALTLRKVHEEMANGVIKPTDMARRLTELRNDVPEEILLRAEDTARYATFTKEPGKITKNFARFVNSVPGGRYLIPFINTPSNLFNASIERTPFAPLQKQFRDAVRRGGPDASIAMTKMTMGMSLMSMSMSKTFDGDITGSGPPFWSPEAARWKATGKQPYSIKIGDKWVPYNRFDPMGMVLGLGADMAERLQQIDESDADSLADYQNLLAGTTFSLASQITNKSYMQGAASLFDAIENGNISANSFANLFAGSMVPSGLGEAARLVDPTQRQAYDFVTKWKSRVPGLSSTLEPRLDMWGREQKYGTGNTLIDMFNPMNITKSNVTPIDHEFELQGWSIPGTIRGFTTEGAEISFRGRPEIANFMLKTSRATKPSEMGDPSSAPIRKLLRKYGDYSMHELMNMVVTGNHPLYRKYAKKDEGPDGGKVGMLKAIYKDYYEAAKGLTLDKFPELQVDIMQQEADRLEKAARISEQRKRDAAGDAP